MALEIQKNSSLQSFNSMAVSANAKALVQVTTINELNQALDYAEKNQLPSLILGEGSNTIFERDYHGVVILNRMQGISVVEDTDSHVIVNVLAGENWHGFVAYTLGNDWFGLENLALIPGMVGAAPMQNIGAYGVEVKDSIVSVEYLDKKTRQLRILSNKDCGFAYRESRFKSELANEVVITSVNFCLNKKPNLNLSYPALSSCFDFTPTPRQVFDAVCSIRQSKLPLPSVIPNTGSFFKNPVVDAQHHDKLKSMDDDLVSYPVHGGFKLAAGWLIEKAGWKKKSFNGVSVHQQQALVLVNPEKRSGKEVVDYAKKIQQDIHDRYGVQLEIEPRIYN